MATSAVVMLVISVVVLWGGFIAAALWLRAHPDPAEEPSVD